MIIAIEILTNNRQKIPSWKVDIVQNLGLQNTAVPRKTHISGHFHLKHPIITENNLCNKLIS
jgi:hypothetical protein